MICIIICISICISICIIVTIIIITIITSIIIIITIITITIIIIITIITIIIITIITIITIIIISTFITLEYHQPPSKKITHTQIWVFPWVSSGFLPKASRSPTSTRHGSARAGRVFSEERCGTFTSKTWGKHGENHGEKTMNTSTDGDSFFGLRLILGRWPVQFIWSVFGTLLDVSWLLGEITSLEMAGKQVVGEPKIWVMFLLEESLPCVQPLLYLVWKKSSVILHGSTVIIVCFFWDEAKPGGSGIHTELIFYTCTQISTFGPFGHQPHCLSTVLSIQGQNVTLARYMFCCKQRDILQPSCTCSPSINRTIEFNTWSPRTYAKSCMVLHVIEICTDLPIRK